MRLLIAVLLIAACACSGGDNDDTPASIPTAVTTPTPADRLNDEGYFCSPTPAAAEQFTSTSEVCRVDEENVSLYTFATLDDREQWRTEVNAKTCDVFAGRTFYTVELETTVIAPVSEKLARDLASVLGAELHTLNC